MCVCVCVREREREKERERKKEKTHLDFPCLFYKCAAGLFVAFCSDFLVAEHLFPDTFSFHQLNKNIESALDHP